MAEDKTLETTEEVKVDDKKDDKSTVETPQSVSTVSLKDYEVLQAQLLEANSKVEATEKEKVEIQRLGVLNSLKSINPKLMEINKDAELSTLNAVLTSFKETSSGFKKHTSDVDTETKPAIIKNTGYRRLGSNEWIE